MFFLDRTNSKLGRLKIACIAEEMSSCHGIGKNGPELPQIFGISDSLFVDFLDYSVDDQFQKSGSSVLLFIGLKIRTIREDIGK
jgi:hypothetical protein